MSELAAIEELLEEEPKHEDELSQIEDLLLGKEEEDDVDSNDTVDVPEKEQIDYTKEVPMPDGTRVTVGELKDIWQTQSKQALEISERENTMIEQLKELNQLAEWIDAVPQEIREQVVANNQKQLAQEHINLLNVIPAWKDRNSYELGRQEIYELAKEYDLVELVSNLTDHKAIKLLNDFAKIKKSLKTVVQPIKKPTINGKPVTPNKANDTDKLINRAKNTRNSDHELEAIKALLG